HHPKWHIHSLESLKGSDKTGVIAAMRMQRTNHRCGVVSLRLLSAIAAIGLLLPLVLRAADPGWWMDKGVTKIDPNTGLPAEANDYAAVNQGQVKNIAIEAIAELNAHL